VESIGTQVQDLILVINKADRTSDPERAAAVKFTREILEKRLHRPMGEIFEVSAAERMEDQGPCGIGKNCWRACMTLLRTRAEISFSRLATGPPALKRTTAGYHQ